MFFTVTALQLYWNCTSAWVFSWKFVAYFRTPFPRNTSSWLLLPVAFFRNRQKLLFIRLNISKRNLSLLMAFLRNYIAMIDSITWVMLSIDCRICESFRLCCSTLEVATGDVLYKKLLLKNSQNSQENTCVEAFFKIKL